MAVLKIITGVDNKILRTKSAPVKKIDRLAKKLVADMIEIIQSVDGLGIAAPQVGVNLRIFIARLNFNTANEIIVAMINPEFLKMSEETEEGEEGCLSVPGKFGIVRRAKSVTIKYLDLRGQLQILNLSDLNARIVQHETDHINGILFVDKMVREIGSKDVKNAI
ncbi:peptide deformylase [Candidatus Peregrinibacteria bacterium]|nr:peptide deformylase [Candidatus Peregrinibacteria bacterium]